MTEYKRMMRSVVSLILVAVLLVGYIPAGAFASGELTVQRESTDVFTPVVRFAVTSDTHIRPASDPLNGYDQLEALMNSVYAYSEAQTYNKLDGLFFVGDNTNRGAASEQTYFFNYVKGHLKEGTEFRAVLGNHEFYANGYDYDGDVGPAEFMKYSGFDAVDFHLELNGYHIIMASMNKYGSYSYFTDTKLAWMKQEIEAAIADDPDKPIFVMQHMSPYDTMKGSTGTGSDKKLRTLLDNYPQVINFSGHTHVSMSDPRVIWQETFTALNSGSLAYLGLPIMGVTNGGRGLDEEGGWSSSAGNQGARNGRLYYMVEIDADSRVRILTVDMYSNTVFGEPYIIDSLKPADFKYTNARSESAVKPEFAAGASLKVVTNNYKNTKITIPQATCRDIVQSYRVEVYNGDTLEQTIYRSSCVNYGSDTPAFINAYITGLTAATQYTVKVYASSSWNLDSDPLTATFTTSTDDGTVKADVLDVEFLQDGSAVNKVSGETLKVHGAPAVAYDTELKQYVATFDGVDDAYAWWGMGNWYEVLGDSFTLDTFVYFEEKPTSNVNILSNMQSAGMGLRYLPDGNVYFYCKAGEGEYVTPSGSVAVGNWAHLVGTYDGNTVKFYINGELAGKADATGNLTIPDYMARFLALGADSAVNGVEGFWNGKIASAKIYSKALTKSQVEALYDAGEIKFCKHCHQSTSAYTAVDGTLAAAWADGEAIVSGHYVLQTNVDLTAALTVASTETVCIDLNGYSISAKAACRTINNAGTLYLMNGNVVGSGAASFDNIAKGANIYNSNKLTIDAVHISGGKATEESYSATTIGASGEYGGNIYNTGAGVLTITDSTISGGLAHRGGNIYNVGTTTITDSTITGGHAERGGNIATSNGTMNLVDSQITDGLGSWDGRDIYCTNRVTKLYIDGSTISSTGQNSSIRLMYGNMVMYSGTVYSGTDEAITSSGTAGSPVSTVTVYGGSITGDWNVARSADIKVYGGTINGNLTLGSTLTADASLQFYNGRINGFDPSAYLADCACVQATEGGYVVWNYGHKEGTCDETCAYEVALTESTKITQENGGHSYTDDGTQWVCTGCGTRKAYKENTECAHGCTVDQWIPWDGVTVADGAHYYLTEDITLTDQVQISGMTVCIDLNGFTVTAPKAERAFRLTTANTLLNLMDTSEANTGTVKGSGVLKVPTDADANAHGGLIYVHTAHLNIYNATVTDGMTTGERGGNIYCASGIVTLYNAKVTNGQNIDGVAARGGNVCIYNPGAALIIKGSESRVTGGVASRKSMAYGGNIYCGNGANLIIYDGEISGGYADSDGANIELMNGAAASNRNGVHYIYGGTIGAVSEDAPKDVSNFVVYGTTSYLNDLYVFGGYIDAIRDTGNANEIKLYAGTFGFDPRTANNDKSSALGECSCVTVADGVYTVSHTRGTATCSVCSVNDASGEHTYKLTGTHDHTENPLVCSACGYTLATLELSAVTLKPGVAGIYFKGNLIWDETNAGILSCGITVSTKNSQPVADGSDETCMYTAGSVSALVTNILADDKTTAGNKANAKTVIYARAYLQLADGTYIYSGVVACNLQTLVETIDAKQWDALSESQKTALTAMYETYSDVMANWNIPNLKKV